VRCVPQHYEQRHQCYARKRAHVGGREHRLRLELALLELLQQRLLAVEVAAPVNGRVKRLCSSPDQRSVNVGASCKSSFRPTTWAGIPKSKWQVR
jgi:hypothetical protein